MRRALYWALTPLRLIAFLVGVAWCAVIDGADAAEDWYTGGKGLGRLINDQEDR